MSEQGKGKTQYEIVTIFPIATHDGTDQQDVVLDLITRIVKLTGGASVVDQTGYEQWEDAVYFDSSKRVYTITDDLYTISLVRNVCIDAIDALHQRGGIFFQVVGNGNVVVEFLDRTDVRVPERAMH